MVSPSAKDQRRLYSDLAWTWPIISPVEDYVKEAGEIAGVIREHSQIEVKTLLDLGCGGGHNDYTLKKYFKITGVDLSQPMLSMARRLNPEIDYQAGDIRKVRLGKTFDSVIIHDAINYMLSEQELRTALETAFVHLAPGGVFWTYAEVTVESFQQNRTYCTSHRKADVEITFIENAYDPDPGDTAYEESLVYLIRRKGSLEIETDRHLAGIFTLETWISLLKDVGFGVKQTEFGPESCPAFVCTRQ